MYQFMQPSSGKVQTRCCEYAIGMLCICNQCDVCMQIKYWVDANRNIQNYQKYCDYKTELKDFDDFGIPNILNRPYILK